MKLRAMIGLANQMEGGAGRALAVDSEPPGEAVRKRFYPKVGRRPEVSEN